MGSRNGNNASSACRINTTDEEEDGKVSNMKNDEEEDDETTSALESLKRGSQLPVFDCPVCLQNASFPVQLPCHHIFCFLCVKGVAQRDKRCAMCRQPIPSDFFHDPKLLCYDEIKKNSETIFDEGYQWFYEGRNGWWQYDERTSIELEKRYKKGDKIFELLIAGFLYVIDLENMRQYRRNDASRRRRVRRDLRNIPGIKGIAGLRYNEAHPSRPSGDGGEAAGSSGTNTSGAGIIATMTTAPGDGNIADDSYLTPPAPNNTPQTPMTPADSQPGSLSGSQEDLSVHLQNLHLDRNSHTAMPHHSHSILPVRTLSPDYLPVRRDQSHLYAYASSRNQAADGHPFNHDKEDDEEEEEQEGDGDSQLFNVTHNSENSDDSITLPNMSRTDERDGFIRGENVTGDDLSPTQRFQALHYEEEEEEEDESEEDMGAAADRARLSQTTTKHGKYETQL